MVAETFRPVMKAVLTGAMSGLLLVGCATTPMAPAPDRPHGGKTWPPVTSPAPTPEQPVEVEQVEIEKPAKKADEPVEINPSSPVYGLLQEARAARAEGNLAAASRYLERALNVAQLKEAAVLYREMGELRMAEGQTSSAEGIFMRALRDAPANNGWKAELWEKIEIVRKAQGNLEGAAAAAARAQRLRES
ncbi:MAG TPA: hypothetical protein VK099_06485 [Alcanivoracaceae bacterium]|nr:hypothetical protein [Alcanivoracaceae bacterium]